jgi:hypothetical protein
MQIASVLLSAALAVASPSAPRHSTSCHYAPAGTGGANVTLIFDVISVQATTCRAAKRVLRAVSRWADPDDYEHLGASRHPLTLGYRCRVYLIGDSAWHVRCVRGRRVIYGFTAQ